MGKQGRVTQHKAVSRYQNIITKTLTQDETRDTKLLSKISQNQGNTIVFVRKVYIKVSVNSARQIFMNPLFRSDMPLGSND